jgi:hypothetical protein
MKPSGGARPKSSIGLSEHCKGKLPRHGGSVRERPPGRHQAMTAILLDSPFSRSWNRWSALRQWRRSAMIASPTWRRVLHGTAQAVLKLITLRKHHPTFPNSTAICEIFFIFLCNIGVSAMRALQAFRCLYFSRYRTGIFSASRRNGSARTSAPPCIKASITQGRLEATASRTASPTCL